MWGVTVWLCLLGLLAILPLPVSAGGKLLGKNVQVTDRGLGDFSRAQSAAVAARGNTVYAVWLDERETGTFSYSIYFAKSTNGSATWGRNVRVNDIALNGTSIEDPAIALGPNGEIWVIWYLRFCYTSFPDGVAARIASMTDASPAPWMAGRPFRRAGCGTGTTIFMRATTLSWRSTMSMGMSTYFCVADLTTGERNCVIADYQDPDFAPNSNWLVFAADFTGQGEIWKAKLGGNGKLSHFTQLTRGAPGMPASAPAWSSDGQWIIFQRDVNTTATVDLHLFAVRADGDSLRALNVAGSDPAWYGGGQ